MRLFHHRNTVPETTPDFRRLKCTEFEYRLKLHNSKYICVNITYHIKHYIKLAHCIKSQQCMLTTDALIHIRQKKPVSAAGMLTETYSTTLLHIT